jgi:hypothetical protein
MSSAIHPDKSGNLTGQPGSQPEPAKANPLRHKRPPAKPAAAKPAAVQPQPEPIVVAAREADDRGRRAFAGMLRQTPAWTVSILVHVVAILAMALFVTPPPEKPVAVAIVSSASESDEPVAEFTDELPTETPALDATTTEQPVPDQPVVVDPGVITEATDTTAALPMVDTSAFGDLSAPASDMLASVSGAVGTAAKGPYSKRSDPARAAARNGGDPQTEAAVDRALEWLAEHQMPDGGWSFDLEQCPKCKGKCSNSPKLSSAHDRCGATAIALLPFLGRGNTPQEGRYKKEVDRGIRFLVDLSVKGNGNAAKANPLPPRKAPGDPSGYSQALAAMALAEAYGMTRNEQLLVPAQAAIDCVMAWQNPSTGGWGYNPKTGSTTSIACMNALALKTGQLAGLQVNPASFQRFGEWLDFVAYKDGAGYGYVSNKDENMWMKNATTSQGLLCRMYLGWKRTNPALQRGIEALAKRGPDKGNFYYDYYASQVMHHAQGPAWDAWNAQMKGILLQSQSAAGHEKGSWLVKNGDKGVAYGGRLYMTAMATMTLEVYYRHMSIYGDQATAGNLKD